MSNQNMVFSLWHTVNFYCFCYCFIGVVFLGNFVGVFWEEVGFFGGFFGGFVFGFFALRNLLYSIFSIRP